MRPFLEIEHLTVMHPHAERNSVSDISCSPKPSSLTAIVGESGSGKTTLSRAITRLFPMHPGTRVTGVVRFEGTDLLSCSMEELSRIRRSRIRYIFQEPHLALNPSLTIRRQLQFSAPDYAPEQLSEILSLVGLQDATDILRSYTHQLSVGMAQRVMIAMALLPRPALVIADEPTSALDTSLRRQLLELLVSQRKASGMALLLITHDLHLAQRYADDIIVMHRGRIVEQATTEKFFQNPEHDHSKALLRALTVAHAPNATPSIPGAAQ